MPKHGSKSKKHRKKNKYDDLLLKPEKLVSKLLKWSRTGRARKLDAVLDACGEGARALAAVKDLHGMTLLHQACQSGHEDAVRVLLRHGADTEARDTYGNTPAHTAAAANQLMVLQLLLTCAHPPDITLRNARGVSIEDLMEHKLEIDRNQPAPSPALLGNGTAGRGGTESMSASEEEEEEEDPDAAWSRRLAEEASDGEGGRQGHSTSWHGSGAAGGAAGGAGEGEEDEEAWADRLWQEMQQRRRQTARNAARSFASTFAEAHAAEQAQKDAAHAETMARLAAAQKLLQEEQAKDRRWRQQAAQGGLIENGVVRVAPLDPAIARRVYDERWAALDLRALEGPTSGGTRQLGLADVPWPLPEGHPYSVDNLRDVLLGDAQGPADIRRRLRAELMRWHPDKFSARFDRLVRPSDLAAVLARVKDISQGLTGMLVS